MLTGTYGELVDSVVFGDWIFFGLTVAAVFRFRRRFPVAARDAGAFRLPGHPVVPALFVAAALLVVGSAIQSNPKRSAVGAALLAAGIPVYAYYDRRGRRWPDARDALPTWSGRSPARARGSISPGATCSRARSRTCRARATPSTSPARAPRAIRRWSIAIARAHGVDPSCVATAGGCSGANFLALAGAARGGRRGSAREPLLRSASGGRAPARRADHLFPEAVRGRLRRRPRGRRGRPDAPNATPRSDEPAQSLRDADRAGPSPASSSGWPSAAASRSCSTRSTATSCWTGGPRRPPRSRTRASRRAA